MKAIFTNNDSFRVLEKVDNNANFNCRYSGGTKYPFNDFETVITLTFEQAVNSLFKGGYKLELIEA